MAMPADTPAGAVLLRPVPAPVQETARPAIAGPIRLGAPPRSAFQLRIGHASRGAGKPNEDFYGVANPGVAAVAARGLALAVADGVSGDGGARTAAETTVRSLLDDYYDTPEQWNIGRALDRVLRAINDWLVGENLRRPDGEGLVSTLSMLLFKDEYYYLAHVGDTRVYRRRKTVLKQLTTDHTWPRRDMRHVLRRAIGLDTHLVAQYGDGELQDGDTFLIASDGVWEVLGERALHDALEPHVDPQVGADLLVKSSIDRQSQYMGRNDATAVIARVEPAA
jgi:serine/threonine protein phosphatase PrpC